MVVFPAVVMMVILQQPGTGEVDDQAENRHGDRLVEVDIPGFEHPVYGLEEHHKGDNAQGDGTGETAQHAHLPRSEGEAGVVAVLTSIAVGEKGDHKGGDMGAHMPAISQQGHGAVDAPCGDLHGHRHRREHEDVEGAPFALLVDDAEVVAVGQPFDGTAVHR